MSKVRDYRDEYVRFHGRPEEIKKRAARNSAHAKMVKSHGKAAIAGKDVDHVKPLRSGGGNGKANLRVASISSNRGWEKKR